MQRRKRTDRVRGWRKRSRYSGTVPPVLAVSRTGGGLRRVCRMAGEASGSRLLWVRGVRGLDVPCDYKKKAPEAACFFMLNRINSAEPAPEAAHHGLLCR